MKALVDFPLSFTAKIMLPQQSPAKKFAKSMQWHMACADSQCLLKACPLSGKGLMGQHNLNMTWKEVQNKIDSDQMMSATVPDHQGSRIQG